MEHCSTHHHRNWGGNPSRSSKPHCSRYSTHSATPALETLHNARTGRFRHLVLSQRAGQAALLAVWEATLQQTLDAMRPGLRRLAEAGVAVPEVGLELADEKGRVLADAELAWPPEKLVVLRDDQSDLSEAWAAAQWKVVELDEGLVTAGGVPWQGVVATALGLTLDNEEEQ